MFGIARRLAKCSTGWCVGPSSPRPIESCVATKITRCRISAAKAQRRPAIIGEHQERAAIRDDPAMDRHAVHGGDHGVLADAVADVAAGIVRRAKRRRGAGAGQVGMGEVGRAADEARHRLRQQLERHLAGLAGGRGRPVGRQLALVARSPPHRGLPAAPGNGARERAPRRSGRGRLALVPGGVPGTRPDRRRRAKPPGSRPASRTADRASPGRPAPLRSRPHPAGCRGVEDLPALVGAPLPITVRQAISDGRPVSSRAARIACSTASGSWPSTAAACQP